MMETPEVHGSRAEQKLYDSPPQDLQTLAVLHLGVNHILVAWIHVGIAFESFSNVQTLHSGSQNTATVAEDAQPPGVPKRTPLESYNCELSSSPH